jgi:hypothetical protein
MHRFAQIFDILLEPSYKGLRLPSSVYYPYDREDQHLAIQADKHSFSFCRPRLTKEIVLGFTLEDERIQCNSIISRVLETRIRLHLRGEAGLDRRPFFKDAHVY